MKVSGAGPPMAKARKPSPPSWTKWQRSPPAPVLSSGVLLWPLHLETTCLDRHDVSSQKNSSPETSHTPKMIPVCEKCRGACRGQGRRAPWRNPPPARSSRADLDSPLSCDWAWDVTSVALGSCRGCVILSSDVAVRRHVKRQGIREWGFERIIGLSVSEMFDLETNEHVQKAISDRQMPKVEYRKIETDDYSECFRGDSLCATAIAMPAGRGGAGRGPPVWAPTAPSPARGTQGKPTVFIGKTLALCQTEINRSGDFCPPEADSLDVVPDENSLLGGEQAWTPPRAEASPRRSLSVPPMPLLPVSSPLRVAQGLGGVLAAGDPQRKAGGRGGWRPSAPFLGLCPPSELSVQPFSEFHELVLRQAPLRAPGPGWMGPALQAGRGSRQLRQLCARRPATQAQDVHPGASVPTAPCPSALPVWG